MKKAAPLLVLAATMSAFAGFLRLWWIHAGLERNYLLDYARLTLGVPSYTRWPYRIERVYHLSPAYVPQIFHDEPLYMVLLWPLAAAMAVFLCSMFITLALSSDSGQGKVLSGPKVISNIAWKWRMVGKKKGFYIAQ